MDQECKSNQKARSKPRTLAEPDTEAAIPVIQADPDGGQGRFFCQGCEVEMDASSESMLCEDCLTKPRSHIDPPDEKMPENEPDKDPTDDQPPPVPAQDEEIPVDVSALLAPDDPH